MRRLRPLLIALAYAGALSGCKSVGPDYAAPHEAVPDRYAAAPEAAVTASGPQPDSFWWHEFHDPELDRLESQAAGGNLDLKVAYLRFAAARLQVQQARAQGLPSLNAQAQFTREQLGVAGILKAQGIGGGATAPSTQALISSIERPVNLWQLGFDASWELDLFGRVRRSVEAANAQSAEALESRNDMLVTLQAEVAQNYLQLRGAQVLLHVTRDEIAAQRDVLELTRSRQQHGLAAQADVESAQAQLSSLESQLPPFDESLAGARHALAVLTGQAPEALDTEFGDAGELPPLPAAVDVGVPSTLARRRPDIRSAEAALHAATAQIGVSVAELFPDISLTGTYGLRNTGTRYLFDWSSRFYTLAPSISLPIFRGGSLLTNVRLSKVQAAQAALSYRKAVLSALQEVEDGLTSLHDDAVRSAALADAVAADERAVTLDLDSYRRGLLPYLSVLTVQLQTIQARQQLAQAQLTASTDLVKLYKALGGGWDDAAASTALANPR